MARPVLAPALKASLRDALSADPLGLLLDTNGPAIDLNFLTGTLDSRITFARASAATYFDTTGTLQTAGNNTPRFDHDASGNPLGLLIEEARTNSLPNPRGEGASGTTAPTGWSQGVPAGLTATWTPSMENGIPGVDVTFSGTTTTTVAVNVVPTGTTNISVTPGQVWTSSVYLRLLAGALPHSFNLINQETNSAGTVVAGSPAVLANFSPTSAPLATQRFGGTSTITNASTVYSRPYFTTGTLTAGTVVDFTLRVGGFQYEQGAFATSLILPPVGSPAAATRATDVASMPFAVQAGSAVSLFAQGIFGSVSDGTNHSLAQIDAGTNTNRLINYLTAAAGKVYAQTGTANAVVGPGQAAGIVVKSASSYDATSLMVSTLGLLTTSVSGGSVPALTTLRLGTNSVGASVMGGWLQRVRVWKRALSAAELQGATQ